jgi:hypothetical protein
MKPLDLFHWLGNLKALAMDSLGIVAVVGAALLLTILIKRRPGASKQGSPTRRPRSGIFSGPTRSLWLRRLPA